MKNRIGGLFRTGLVAGVMMAAFAANVWGVQVENVRGEQREGSNKVDIWYDLPSSKGCTYEIELKLEGKKTTPAADTLSGDFGTGVTPGKNKHIVWDAGKDFPKSEDDIKAVITATEEIGVKLWKGGPYWAECNVGASKPEECGLYFWWGDTVGHAGDWYFDANHCPTYGKSISELQALGYIDSTGNLAPAHDAATAHLGAPWRMPTDAEFAALVSNCDTQWTTRNGVNGRLVKGRGAYSSKSIFLPAAGRGDASSFYSLGSYGGYWSSTPYSVGSYYAWCLGFGSGNNFFRYCGYRSYGQSVRPVRGFAK